jgi:adenylate kinase family enzyme
MKHILYKTGVEIPGYVIKLSSYLNYYIGRIPDEYDDQRVELKKINAVIIPEDIAPGFKFADIYKDYVSIRSVSHIMDEFPQFANSAETDDQKVKYYLTDEDRELAVKYNKFVMLKVIADRFSERMKNLTVDASDLEVATWEEQKREALLYQSDNTASTPLIDILATGRGIDREVLVTKILVNVEAYKVKLANLLVEQQQLEQRVKSCQNIPDCHRLKHEKFGMSMSYQQQLDENIESSPLTLTMDF